MIGAVDWPLALVAVAMMALAIGMLVGFHLGVRRALEDQARTNAVARDRRRAIDAADLVNDVRVYADLETGAELVVRRRRPDPAIDVQVAIDQARHAGGEAVR